MAADGVIARSPATPVSGAAFALERKSGGFVHTAYLKANVADASAVFGTSVAIDGDTIVVGAEHAADHGAAYVFTRNGASWKQQAVLTARSPTGREE